MDSHVRVCFTLLRWDFSTKKFNFWMIECGGRIFFRGGMNNKLTKSLGKFGGIKNNWYTFVFANL